MTVGSLLKWRKTRARISPALLFLCPIITLSLFRTLEASRAMILPAHNDNSSVLSPWFLLNCLSSSILFLYVCFLVSLSFWSNFSSKISIILWIFFSQTFSFRCLRSLDIALTFRCGCCLNNRIVDKIVYLEAMAISFERFSDHNL